MKRDKLTNNTTWTNSISVSQSSSFRTTLHPTPPLFPPFTSMLLVQGSVYINPQKPDTVDATAEACQDVFVSECVCVYECLGVWESVCVFWVSLGTGGSNKRRRYRLFSRLAQACTQWAGSPCSAQTGLAWDNGNHYTVTVMSFLWATILFPDILIIVCPFKLIVDSRQWQKV